MKFLWAHQYPVKRGHKIGNTYISRKRSESWDDRGGSDSNYWQNHGIQWRRLRDSGMLISQFRDWCRIRSNEESVFICLFLLQVVFRRFCWRVICSSASTSFESILLCGKVNWISFYKCVNMYVVIIMWDFIMFYLIFDIFIIVSI